MGGGASVVAGISVVGGNSVVGGGSVVGGCPWVGVGVALGGTGWVLVGVCVITGSVQVGVDVAVIVPVLTLVGVGGEHFKAACSASDCTVSSGRILSASSNCSWAAHQSPWLDSKLPN